MHSLFGYALVGVGLLEFALAFTCLSTRQRQNLGSLRGSVFLALLTTSFYAFFAGITYLRGGRGLDYAIPYNLCWLGFAAIPGIIEMLLVLNNERARWKFFAARSLYVAWGWIVYLSLVTDWIDIPPPTLIPYTEVIARFEMPARGFAALQILYIVFEAFRARRNAQGLSKSRVGYLALGLSLYGITALIASTLIRSAIDPALTSFFSIFFAIPVAYATTQQRLFDLRLLIGRLLNGFVSTALFASLHYASFVFFRDSGVTTTMALTLAALVVAAVVFLTPALSWLREGFGFILRSARLSHRDVLAQFNESLLQSQNVDEVFRKLGSVLRAGLGVTSYAVFFCENSRLRLRVAESLDEHKLLVRPTEPPEVEDGAVLETLRQTGDVLLREEILVESESSPQLRHAWQIFDGLHGVGRYELLIPLLRKGDLLGLLCLGPQRDGSAYTTEDIDLLGTLGTQLALSVENARLFSEAVEDGLTGLFHQKYFKARLATELARARRHAKTLGLLLVDVDHFKSINDTHGHVMGDHVLATMGPLLRSSFRGEDIVSRYGGEEFAILLVEPDAEQIQRIAERVRERVAEENFSERFRVTVSIGVYICSPGDPITNAPVTQILERVDSALYRAKRGGRNRVVTYSPSAELTGAG